MGTRNLSTVLIFCLIGGYWTVEMVCGQQNQVAPEPGPRDLLVREAYLMGTNVLLELWATDRFVGMRQLEKFLGILERTEAELSTWQEESQISIVNYSPVGRDLRLGQDSCVLFGRLEELHSVSAGSFDPAIGRLVEAWGLRRVWKLPSEAELNAARDSSGFQLISYSPETCTVRKSGDVQLDSGAFGKGEALRRVAEYARRNTTGPWRINLGGQVAVHRLPPGKSYWEVEIASPRNRARPLLEVNLPGGSVATSGNQVRRKFVDGVEVGHILDPRTGWPSKYTGSVTVWHKDALVADALATALHVMGPEAGVGWANDNGIAACFINLTETEGVEVWNSESFAFLLPLEELYP